MGQTWLFIVITIHHCFSFILNYILFYQETVCKDLHLDVTKRCIIQCDTFQHKRLDLRFISLCAEVQGQIKA